MAISKKNIQVIPEIIEEMVKKDFNNEILFNAVCDVYNRCCSVLSKKPISNRQWKKRIFKLKVKKLDFYNLDDLFINASVLCCFEDSKNVDIAKATSKMYKLTLKKLKK